MMNIFRLLFSTGETINMIIINLRKETKINHDEGNETIANHVTYSATA